MPPGKSKAGGSVGQALIRHRFQRGKGFTNASEGKRHVTAMEGPAGKELVSVVDHSDLDELLQTAELAGREFSAVRGQAVVEMSSAADGVTSAEEQRAEEDANRKHLKVPRRPAWHSGMTAEELDASERAAFLEWRRSLARLEDNARLCLTPFEKNLDIWRQLWRVLERSDLVVTVVDCRNPLFYRCPDMEAYVKQLDEDKQALLLLNKSDLLPETARLQWASYFRKNKIDFCFWSAKQATEETNLVTTMKREKGSHSTLGERHESGEEEEQRDGEDADDNLQAIKILSREELLELLEEKAGEVMRRRRLRSEGGGETSREGNGESLSGLGVKSNLSSSSSVMVGFVGYPNVGKSSTINALVGAKKTGVTSTPGKTKHFQTLIISPSLTLCDCPGLVFPSFSSSRADMVAAGVLPIDRMTDQRGPVGVVASRISRRQLQQKYGITLPVPAAFEDPNRAPTAAELLRSYAASRGLVASSGLPDETRASRQILKDFLSGHLLHFFLPPDAEVGREGGGEEEEGDVETEEGIEEDAVEEVEEDLEEEEEEEEEDDGQLNVGGVTGVSGTGSIQETEAGKNQTGRTNVASLQAPGDGDLLSDFELLSVTGGRGLSQGTAVRRKPAKAAHKMHKKAARKKDRTWRVGNDGSDGMPIVRGVQRPISFGAARMLSVLPD